MPVEDKDSAESLEQPPRNKMWMWIRRMGVGAFLFFLIKGLLWLTVPALIAWFASR